MQQQQRDTRLMHCFAHCRIVEVDDADVDVDAGAESTEVHLANKKNCINFIKFEMSSNCRATVSPLTLILRLTISLPLSLSLYLHAICILCFVCVCVCDFTSAMTSSGAARLNQKQQQRQQHCHGLIRFPCSVCSNIKNCAPKSPK